MRIDFDLNIDNLREYASGAGQWVIENWQTLLYSYFGYCVLKSLRWARDEYKDSGDMVSAMTMLLIGLIAHPFCHWFSLITPPIRFANKPASKVVARHGGAEQWRQVPKSALAGNQFKEEK